MPQIGLASQPCAILDSFNATLASTSDADANWLGTPDPWLDGRAPRTPRAGDADLPGLPGGGAPDLPSPRLLNVLESHAADWPEDTLDSLSRELPELPYPEQGACSAAQTACEPCTPGAPEPRPATLAPQRAVGSCDFCPAHAISPVTPTQPTLLEAAVFAAMRQLQPTPGGHVAAETLGLLEWLGQSRQLARVQALTPADGAEQFFTPQACSDAGESPGPSCYGTPLPVLEVRRRVGGRRAALALPGRSKALRPCSKPLLPGAWQRADWIHHPAASGMQLLEGPPPASAGEDAAITPLLRAIELCDESDFLTAPAAESGW